MSIPTQIHFILKTGQFLKANNKNVHLINVKWMYIYIKKLFYIIIFIIIIQKVTIFSLFYILGLRYIILISFIKIIYSDNAFQWAQFIISMCEYSMLYSVSLSLFYCIYLDVPCLSEIEDANNDFHYQLIYQLFT